MNHFQNEVRLSKLWIRLLCDEKEKWEKVHFILNKTSVYTDNRERGSGVIFYNRGLFSICVSFHA